MNGFPEFCDDKARYLVIMPGVFSSRLSDGLENRMTLVKRMNHSHRVDLLVRPMMELGFLAIVDSDIVRKASSVIAKYSLNELITPIPSGKIVFRSISMIAVVEAEIKNLTVLDVAIFLYPALCLNLFLQVISQIDLDTLSTVFLKEKQIPDQLINIIPRDAAVKNKKEYTLLELALLTELAEKNNPAGNHLFSKVVNHIAAQYGNLANKIRISQYDFSGFDFSKTDCSNIQFDDVIFDANTVFSNTSANNLVCEKFKYRLENECYEINTQQFLQYCHENSASQSPNARKQPGMFQENDTSTQARKSIKSLSEIFFENSGKEARDALINGFVDQEKRLAMHLTN